MPDINKDGYTPGEVRILMKLERLDEQVKTIKDNQEKNPEIYVRKEEFSPIQRLVYGLVGVVLLAVMGALVAMVMQ